MLPILCPHVVKPKFEIMSLVGDRIRLCRQKLGLTQETLAKDAGMSKGILSEVET